MNQRPFCIQGYTPNVPSVQYYCNPYEERPDDDHLDDRNM